MHEIKPKDLENISSGVSSYFSVSVTVQHDWQHDFLLSSGDESVPFLYTCRLSAHATNEWQIQTTSAVVAASAAYYFWCSLCTSSEQQLACEPPPLSFTCSWSGGREHQRAKAAALLSIIEKVPPLKASPWNVRLHVSGFMHGRQVGPREHQNRSNKGHKKTKTRGETPSRRHRATCQCKDDPNRGTTLHG